MTEEGTTDRAGRGGAVEGGIPPVRILMATHLWMHWLQIAAKREHEAVAASERIRLVDHSAGGTAFGDAMADEMHASMEAVTAAACAIDALYGEVLPLVEVPDEAIAAWKANHTAREMRIFETLKRGCKLGARNRTWPPEFKALYRLRNPMTHHVIRSLPAVPHPSGVPTNVAQENADYIARNATAAVDLAFEVVLTALTEAKAPKLKEWGDRMPHVPGVVRGYRDIHAAT